MTGAASLRDTKWRGNLEGLRDVGLLRSARNDVSVVMLRCA